MPQLVSCFTIITFSLCLHFCHFLVISKEKWESMMLKNGLNYVDLRDNRYNQIVHMVSAANGAEEFYTLEVSMQSLTLNLVETI